MSNQSIQTIDDNKMIIIPIGTFCYMATLLAKLNYRCTALPFDYIRSNISMVDDCINNNFEDFLNKNNYTNKGTGIIKYGNDIFIHHDMENTDVYNKMKQRTKYFLNILNMHNILKVYIAIFQPWTNANSVLQNGDDVDKVILDLKKLYKTIKLKTKNFHIIGIINRISYPKNKSTLIFKEENLLIYDLETISPFGTEKFIKKSDELYLIKLLREILKNIDNSFEETRVINFTSKLSFQ